MFVHTVMVRAAVGLLASSLLLADQAPIVPEWPNDLEPQPSVSIPAPSAKTGDAASQRQDIRYGYCYAYLRPAGHPTPVLVHTGPGACQRF